MKNPRTKSKNLHKFQKFKPKETVSTPEEDQREWDRGESYRFWRVRRGREWRVWRRSDRALSKRKRSWGQWPEQRPRRVELAWRRRREGRRSLLRRLLRCRLAQLLPLLRWFHLLLPVYAFAPSSPGSCDLDDDDVSDENENGHFF